MKCIDCIHRGVCVYLEEECQEKNIRWGSQKVELMDEKDACDLFEEDVASVVHAEWIAHDCKKTNSQLDMECPYECSNCNYRQGLLPFKYCPNCGAKMNRGDVCD